MRGYGRFIKNISAMLLLAALLSLLLPFCHFQAKGQDTTLSGIEVLTAGAKVGYVYMKDGAVPQDFVLKSPITYGDLREAVAFADAAAGSKVLAIGTFVLVLPVVLCFLAMCMLFMAEGKKTMFFPTLFLCIITIEVLFLMAAFYGLQPFFMIGLYLFAVLNAVALALVLLGWITGGYRRPENDKMQEDDDSRQRKDSDRSRSKRKSRRKRRKRDRNKSKKKEKDSKSKEQSAQGISVSGKIYGGTGIYQGLSWNLDSGKSTGIMIGTTEEVMRNIQVGNWKNMQQLEQYSCKIAYDPSQKQYTVTSHSQRDISLWQNGRMTKCMRMGDRMQVQNRTILRVDGGNDSLHLY